MRDMELRTSWSSWYFTSAHIRFSACPALRNASGEGLSIFPRKGAHETGPEDGEDAEVLDGVGYADALVTRSESVLDEQAEVVWQCHVLGHCANVSDGSEGIVTGASRELDAKYERSRGEDTNVPITGMQEGTRCTAHA